MREKEARQEDRGQSDSSKEQDRDVIVEGAQESGPTSAEATGPPIPTASIQEAEPAMEVDVGDIPPLTSKDATTVTHTRRMTCSRAIPPQWLERWPGYRSPLLKAISPRTAKPRNRSCPPLCVNEVLHMSPLHSLRGRKKKEDLEIMSRMQRQDQALFMYYCSRSRNGGEGRFVRP